MKQYIVTFLMLLITFGVNAQSATQREDMIKKRVQHCVAQMNDNIGYMADPQKDKDTRKYYREMALTLFFKNGEPYVDSDGHHNTGVKMQTTSLYSKKPRTQLMKDYFTGLIGLEKRYNKVDIQSTNVHEIEVSDLQPYDEDTYVCTAYYEQVFVGYKDGFKAYGDKTKKKVNVYVKVDETIDGLEFIVYLGDVTALETSRI